MVFRSAKHLIKQISGATYDFSAGFVGKIKENVIKRCWFCQRVRL